MKYRSKPEEFARRLMKLIVGEDELRSMTPTGWGRSKRIPLSVYKAVFSEFGKK